jgi:hypothetical protein
LLGCFGLPILAQDTTTVQKNIRFVAAAENGTVEVGGKNAGPRINQYRAAVGPGLNKISPLPPWCGCYYYYALLNSGYNAPIVNPALARNWFSNTEHNCNPNARGFERTMRPQTGWGVGYRFNSKHISHVGGLLL